MAKKKRYKEGFDRVGIVLFVLFAAGFLLVYLLAREPFEMPPEGCAERLAIEADLAENCDPENEGPFALLCDERVMAKYRWAHYRADPSGFPMILGGVFVLAIVAFGHRTLRWIVDGFKQG